jgi:antitoxin VapB
LDTARLFWSGRSQAVRLPKQYRFAGKEVRIRRHGEAVILEPIASDWNWLDVIAGQMSDDFLVDDHEQPPMPAERPGLDDVFR